MEENMEVAVEQEVAEPELVPVQNDEATEQNPESEELPEVLPDEAESTFEETIVPEASTEDITGDVDGNEVVEPVLPQVDPQVYAGWQELAQAHPEVVGKPLPDDIMKACAESGLPPLRVYESMMLIKQGEQIAALQQEIATLRQNAEAAERAPVTAASLGGNEGNYPNDEFMKDFNS